MPDLKVSTGGLEEISRQSLDSSNTVEAIITGVKHLASCNWIEAPKPTIAVPGSPALYPLEPLFRALYIEQPSFDIDSIDIVTDRNNVRKLLSFINPTQSKNGLNHPNFGVLGVNSRNYTRSTRQYCIISYRLGNISFLVRYETDGYTSDSKPSIKDDVSIGDNLAEILHSLSLTSETTYTVQMSISQTPKLVRAFHQRGIFSRPEVEDVTTTIKDWERGNQDDIKKLIALANRILRVTRNWGGSSFIRYDRLEDKLVIKQVER
ncbi:geranylgeranyl pyrophosphate synthetase [Penicillium cf. viridicatum]|uniref:Geranylgeranyl pyrophosphate synthetase n=1 Tax=Penicillium cf. viridicatum TaxID=2972119 RepID=A0A9W9MUY4_9EURO|nr:geranylgeranyl pyrophosphate synthetase [Penicillium cf. viridicatum]